MSSTLPHPPQDLEVLKTRQRAGQQQQGQPQRPALPPSSSNKRYLILTYAGRCGRTGVGGEKGVDRPPVWTDHTIFTLWL